MNDYTPEESAFLTQVYSSAGGVMRMSLTKDQLKLCIHLAEMGELTFKEAPYQYGPAFDEWCLPDVPSMREKLEVFKIPNDNDRVDRAVLWNDEDDRDDEDWLAHEGGGYYDEDDEWSEDDEDEDEDDYNGLY